MLSAVATIALAPKKQNPAPGWKPEAVFCFFRSKDNGGSCRQLFPTRSALRTSKNGSSKLAGGANRGVNFGGKKLKIKFTKFF